MDIDNTITKILLAICVAMDYSFDNKNILKHNCQWILNNSLARSFEQEQNVFWEEQY